MKDEVQSQRVICRGGLNTSENFLLLSEESPGSAVRLVNYETSLTGGYRRINGFRPYDAAFKEVTSVGVPAEGRTLGVWGFHNSNTGNFDIIAARKSVGSAVYRFYLYVPVTGWVVITTGITHTSTGVTRVRAETFRVGAENTIIFVDGINEAVVYNGTTWYNLTSAGTGGAGSPGGNQIIDAPAVVGFFKGHVFLSGDENNPAVVAFSAPNDPLTWTAAAGAGQQIAGFDVVQVKPFRDEIFIFGVDAIRKSIPDESAGFVLQDVTNNIGCIARDSVVEVGGNIFFLSSDGIRPVAGTDKIGDVEISTITQSIQNTIVDLSESYTMTDLNAVVIRSKTQFRYFISSPTSTAADSYGLIGSVRTYQQGRLWEFGELIGIRSNSAWSGYDASGDELVLHGDYSGNVYQHDIGNNFDSADILAIYTTPYIDMGDTTIRKLFRKLHLFLRTTGSVTINISVRFDWTRQDVQNPANYSESSTGSIVTYDSGVDYDDGSKYGSAAQPVFDTNIQGSGYAVQFSIVSEGTFAPYTIQGFVTEFSAKGRQ